MATRPPERRHAAAAAIASELASATRVTVRLSAISPSGPRCAQTRLYISSFVPAAATRASGRARDAFGGDADRARAFATGRSQEMPYRSPAADILFSLSAVADLPRLIE